jgi:PAS domain S-box-containing protein
MPKVSVGICPTQAPKSRFARATPVKRRYNGIIECRPRGRPGKENRSMQPQPVNSTPEEKLRLEEQLLYMVEQAVLAVDLTGSIVFWNRFAERLYGWTEEEARGHNIDQLLAAPQLLKSVRANLKKLWRGSESWAGEFLVQRRDGAAFTAHLNASFIQSGQRTLISMVSIARDSIAYRQMQDANQLLAEAAALLVDAADYETPLTTLAQLAVPQLADWCVVHLLQADGSLEQVALAPAETLKQQAAREWLQKHLPNDNAEGLPAVLRSGAPILVTDVATDRQAATAAVKSYMIVPLIARPQILGAITFVAAESGRRFDLNALALVENLVSHIAIYMDKARLYRESQQLNAELEKRVSERTLELRTAVTELEESAGQLQALAANLESAREEERTRIAGELHDQLGQALTAMKFDLAWLSDRLGKKEAILAQKAKTVTAQMDAMIKTVRRIATELRPGMLDDLGLAASIEWQARDFEKRTGVICTVSVPAEDLSPARTQSIALFRIFQEALTNVARHAGAKHIDVTLEATLEALTLQVHDDGRGIQTQQIAGLDSLGLLGMRERVKRLGGNFDIRGIAGQGTTVTVSIPVEQNEP